MEELNLNDFEKKAALTALKDFDIINLIAFNHLPSGNVYYTAFYRYEEFIFSTSLFFTNQSQTDRGLVISTYVDRLKEIISIKLSNIDSTFLIRKPIVESQIDTTAEQLYIIICENHRDFSDFDFINSPIDRGRTVSVKNQCRQMLREGKIPREILKIYLQSIGIDNSVDIIFKIKNTKYVSK